MKLICFPSRLPTPGPVNENHQHKPEAGLLYWTAIPAGFLDISLQIRERNRVNLIFVLFLILQKCTRQ
jgi:hypothetical protein